MTGKKIPANYFPALGRFMHAFAEVEAWMLLLLWEFAGVRVGVARALFSGTRTQDAASYIRRIHQATDRDIDQDLENTFTQISHINAVRNDIVHFGARFDDDGKLTISNWLVAHMPERLRQLPISAKKLDDLTADLELIVSRLRFFTIDEGLRADNEERRPKSASPHYWQTPWRYKPSGQGQPQKKSHQKRKAR